MNRARSTLRRSTILLALVGAATIVANPLTSASATPVHAASSTKSVPAICRSISTTTATWVFGYPVATGQYLKLLPQTLPAGVTGIACVWNAKMKTQPGHVGVEVFTFATPAAAVGYLSNFVAQLKQGGTIRRINLPRLSAHEFGYGDHNYTSGQALWINGRHMLALDVTGAKRLSDARFAATAAAFSRHSGV